MVVEQDFQGNFWVNDTWFFASVFLWCPWGIVHLFERLVLIGWENNRDCHITIPLSLKTLEVQIKGDQ